MAKPKKKSKASKAPKASKASKAAKAAIQTDAELDSITLRAIEALRPHAMKILVVSIAVVVVVGGLSIWTAISRNRAGRATRAFGDIVAKATAPTQEGGPQLDLQSMTHPESVKKPEIKTFEDRSQQALALIAKLESSFHDKVATDVKLVQAGLLYDTSKYDQAIAAYKAFLAGSPPVELAARAHEGIGYALEAKALAQKDAAARNAGLDAALTAFTAIQTDEKGPFYGLALYHRARITALKGDKAAAVALYKKALDKVPATLLADEINNRLSLLEAK